MIPYSLWLFHRGKGSIWKCGIKCKLKSCKMAGGHKVSIQNMFFCMELYLLFSAGQPWMSISKRSSCHYKFHMTLRLKASQNGLSSVNRLISYFPVDEWVFQCLLVIVHCNTNTIMDSNKHVHKQATKETNEKKKKKHVWAFKNRSQTIRS